jgi:hypothetical protein
MIKKILIAVLALAVLLVATVVILAFALPGDYRVERQITINKPKAEVFGYLKMLKNQRDWGPWFRKDPNMKLEYRGTDGNPGFVSAWMSEHSEVGEGEQEIKKVVDGERIDTELRFKAPFETTNNAYIVTEAAGENQTKVRWGFSGSMPKPFNLMSLVMDMDAMVGKEFEEGLNTLKTNLEAK